MSAIAISKTSTATAGLAARTTATLAALGSVAVFSLTPSALAAPTDPHPLSPYHGQACSDLDNLAYDPTLGQIVCDGSSWVRSVEPTGIRNMGTSCARSEMESVMASSTDGYLIWCPSYKGIWVLYRP